MLKPLKTPTTAKPGEWDRHADCYPRPGFGSMQMFSIGIFQWIPGKTVALKKGPAKKRVRGAAHNPEKVLAEANKLVAEYNLRDKITL